MFAKLVRSVIVTGCTIGEELPMISVMTITSGDLTGEKFVIYDPNDKPLNEGPFVINFFRKGLLRKVYAIEAWRGEKLLTYIGPLDGVRVTIGR